MRSSVSWMAGVAVAAAVAGGSAVAAAGQPDVTTTTAAPGAPPPELADDARPAGAPPAGAVAKSYELYSYKGRLIPRDEAAERGLGCVEDGERRPRCYDSAEELARTEKVFSAPRAARTAAARKRALRRWQAQREDRGTKARAATHYGGGNYPLRSTPTAAAGSSTRSPTADGST